MVINRSAFFGISPKIESAKHQLASEFADPQSVLKELSQVDEALRQIGKETFAPNTDHEQEELGSLLERCHDLSLNHQIDDLVEKTQYVASHPLLKSVQEIRNTIKALIKNNALTWENLQYIGLAKQLLAKAENAFHQGGVFIKPPTQVSEKVALSSDEIMDLASDLYEIAGAIYNHKMNEGMRLIKQLSPGEQMRLKEHVEMLGGSFDLLYVIQDAAHHEANCMLVIQALMGMAKEVAGLNDLYPSIEEIEEMFGDLDKISESR